MLIKTPPARRIHARARAVRDHPVPLRHQLTTSRADHGDQLKGLEQAGT